MNRTASSLTPELQGKVSAGQAARRGVAGHTAYRISVNRKPAVSASGPFAPVVRIGGSLRPVCRQRKQKYPINRSFRTAVASSRGTWRDGCSRAVGDAAGEPGKGRLLETRFSNNSSNSNNPYNGLEKLAFSEVYPPLLLLLLVAVIGQGRKGVGSPSRHVCLRHSSTSYPGRHGQELLGRTDQRLGPNTCPNC